MKHTNTHTNTRTHKHTQGGNNGCQNIGSRRSYLDTHNLLLSQHDSKSQCPSLRSSQPVSGGELHTPAAAHVPASVLVFSAFPTEELAAQAHSRAEFFTSLMKLWRVAVCQFILVRSCLCSSLCLRYCFPLLGSAHPVKSQETQIQESFLLSCTLELF